MATEVLDKDRSVAAVATDYHCGWHTVHDHVIAVADAVLDAEPDPVRVLGIDETRRGKAKWETDPDTGRRIWVDRWDTGLVDITGDQGLLAQVNGRNSGVVIDWLAERDQAWRAQITHVAIDLSTVYARAVRLGLPGVIVIVDRFHLVKKANDMVDAVRRRVTWAQRGRRTARSTSSGSTAAGCCAALNGSPTISAPRCSPNAHRRSPRGHRRRLIAKELLRDLLVRGTRRAALRDHRRALPVLPLLRILLGPEILSFARTVEAWQEPIIAAPDRSEQRPHRRLQPHRQTRRPHRLRLPQPRQPTPPRTLACTRRSRQVTPIRRQRPC